MKHDSLATCPGSNRLGHPKRFQHTLNTQILPMLRYPPMKNLLEWTARQWLIKLGWQHMMLKKGVYMDSHERPDVINY